VPTWAETLPFLLLGTVGSLHCVGMCGVFAIAAAGTPTGGARAPRWRRVSAYVGGKAVTYAMLGVLCANAMTLAARTTHELGWHELRAVLAWIAGGALVVTGVSWVALQLRGTLGLPRPLRRLEHGGRWLYVTLRSLPGTSGALGTGLLTGLLPCGLSWSALLLASQLPAPAAAAGMFAFGLATGPALALTAAGWSSLPARARAHAVRFAGVLCIVFGVLVIARGGLPEQLAPLERVLPECCGSGAHAGPSPAGH